MISVTLPLRLMSPNATLREHWTTKAKRRAEERGLVRAHLFAPCSPARTPRSSLVSASVALTCLAPRAFDDDNLQSAFKSVRDGVADALGVKDNDPRIEWRYAQEKSKTYGVRIEIEVKP